MMTSSFSADIASDVRASYALPEAQALAQTLQAGMPGGTAARLWIDADGQGAISMAGDWAVPDKCHIRFDLASMASHDAALFVRAGHGGRGTGTRCMANFVATCASMGVQRFEFTAGSSSGALVWTDCGWLPRDRETHNSLRARIDSRLDSIGTRAGDARAKRLRRLSQQLDERPESLWPVVDEGRRERATIETVHVPAGEVLPPALRFLAAMANSARPVSDAAILLAGQSFPAVLSLDHVGQRARFEARTGIRLPAGPCP